MVCKGYLCLISEKRCVQYVCPNRHEKRRFQGKHRANSSGYLASGRTQTGWTMSCIHISWCITTYTTAHKCMAAILKLYRTTPLQTSKTPAIHTGLSLQESGVLIYLRRYVCLCIAVCMCTYVYMYMYIWICVSVIHIWCAVQTHLIPSYDAFRNMYLLGGIGVISRRLGKTRKCMRNVWRVGGGTCAKLQDTIAGTT